MCCFSANLPRNQVSSRPRRVSEVKTGRDGLNSYDFSDGWNSGEGQGIPHKGTNSQRRSCAYRKLHSAVFQRDVTLLHPDRLVCGLSFLFFNVADFKGIRTG
jgi:hypothetical protein